MVRSFLISITAFSAACICSKAIAIFASNLKGRLPCFLLLVIVVVVVGEETLRGKFPDYGIQYRKEHGK